MRHLILAAALACLVLPRGAAAQTAGDPPGPGEPGAGGQTMVHLGAPVTAAGTLRFWSAYAAEGGRAMLKVYRREADRLVLVGTSPLEALPAAEVATFECAIPVIRNDLVGVFCPDSTCVDRVSGALALVAPGDPGTGPDSVFTQENGAPAVLAGTTAAFDAPSGAARSLVVPVVGRVPGVGGTVWRTSLELVNTSSDDAEAALFFNRSDEDNTAPAASARVAIPAGGTLELEDVLLATLGVESGTGSLDVVADVPIMAHARVANEGDPRGSFGQLVPAVPATWALGDDAVEGLNPRAGVAVLFAAREDDLFRTNLGVANVSGVELEIRVTAWRGVLQLGYPLWLTLPPYSHHQVNRVLPALSIPPPRAGLRLEVEAADGSEGRFVAYASRIDNGTGDAVLLLADHEPPRP